MGANVDVPSKKLNDRLMKKDGNILYIVYNLFIQFVKEILLYLMMMCCCTKFYFYSFIVFPMHHQSQWTIMESDT